MAKRKKAAVAAVAEQVEAAVEHLDGGKRRKRQLPIPGTETNEIREVNVAAELYVDARDARMVKTEAEVEARDALILAMKKHKLENYRDDDATPPLIVTLIAGEDKIKVTRATPDEESGE